MLGFSVQRAMTPIARIESSLARGKRGACPSLRWLWTAISFLALFSGCCTDVRSGAGALIPDWAAASPVEDSIEDLREKPLLTTAELKRVMAHVAKNPSNPSLGAQGLAVSGGGSFAAWSAGWIRGAMESQSNRPLPRRLDVVTGVSAGALVTPLIFSGQPGDLERLEVALTTTEDSQIVDRRWLVGAAFGACDSFGDTTPLRRTLRRILDDDWIRALGTDEVSGGRWFFVATVSSDSGAYHIWNMVGIARAAKNNPAYLHTFREIIRASVSIPVIFDPVKLGDELHIDGGARKNIFFAETVLELLLAHAANPTANPQLPPTVWTVVSGTLDIAMDRSSDFIGFGSRAVSLLLWQGLLYSLEEIQRASGTGFRLSFAIGDDIPPGFNAFEFNPELMTKVYANARRRGQSGDWLREIPRDFLEIVR